MSDVPPTKPCLNPDCLRNERQLVHGEGVQENARTRHGGEETGHAAQSVRSRRRACASCAASRRWAVLRAALGAWRPRLRLPTPWWEALEKAPPDDPKELCSLVYGTFAATEDDLENDRGCKDMLKVVKYKELYDNLGDEGRSTLHKTTSMRERRARAFASR